MKMKGRRTSKNVRINDVNDPKQNAERLAGKMNDAWQATMEDFGLKPKTYRRERMR